MVSFGISPKDRARSTPHENQPTPTTPRQSKLEKLRLTGRRSPHVSRQQRSKDRFYEDVTTGQENRRNNLSESRMSPVRSADGVPQAGSGWRQWAGVNLSETQSSTGRSPEEIQRRRRLLDEAGWISSGYRQQRLSDAGADVGRDLARRDPLNSLEKKSTLRNFAENSARGGPNLRKVSFKLGQDESGIDGPTSGSAAAVASELRAPISMDRSPTRPESAKHRKRGSSAVPENSTTTNVSPEAAKAKRPLSSKARTMPTHDPSARARTTKKEVAVRRDTTERDRLTRKEANLESSVALQDQAVMNRDMTLAKVSTEKYHTSGVVGSSTSPPVPRHQQTMDDCHQSSLAGVKAVALLGQFASCPKDEDHRKPIYSRSSLIHNVSLATKSALQKNCLIELTMADKLRNMEEKLERYLCISCHDWSCNCSRPESVTRYDFKEGQKHFDSVAQVTTRKDYILPEGCRLASGHVTSGVPARWQSRQTVNKLQVHGDDPTVTSSVDDDLALQKQMEMTLASKPISVQRAFRVSGPHWASRSHTQRWPWRGTTWVSVSGDDMTNSRSRCAVK